MREVGGMVVPELKGAIRRMKMKRDTKEPVASIQLTLKEVCELMTEQTGEKITPETHWIETSLEMTRDVKPYAQIKINAFTR